MIYYTLLPQSVLFFQNQIVLINKVINYSSIEIGTSKFQDKWNTFASEIVHYILCLPTLYFVPTKAQKLILGDNLIFLL